MTDTLRTTLSSVLGATYTVESELEGGGMSRVFVALERSLGRRVAIKVLADAGLVRDAERFRAEVRLSAALQHPHIVPVHTAGEVDGIPYFVMPFVEGESLRVRLRERALPLGEATRVLRDVASALHHAHARGIVHRDLKPENVMLSGGSAVVLDFGVAKALVAGAGREVHDRARSALTGAGYAVGTPKYMAPEQAAGDPDLDHRADIYAFGLLAYELFTGQAPFDGSPSEVLRKHIAEAPPDVRVMCPGLAPPLVALVRACLEKAPSARPRDASVLLDVLDGVSTPLTATATGRKDTPRPRSRWLEAIAVPATYLVAAGGTLAYLFHLASQERIREGIVAAGVIGSLLGLPLAVAGGVLVRVVSRERVR